MDECTRCQIAIEKRHHNALDDTEAQAIEHLDGCQECQEYERCLEHVDNLFRMEFDPTPKQQHWQRIARRVRRNARRPLWGVVWIWLLIVVSVIFGFIDPKGWLVAGGLLFATLPYRISRWREQREEIARLAGRGRELLVAYREDLQRQGLKSLVDGLVNGALATLFLLVAPFARDPWPALIVAAILYLRAAYDFTLRRRRLARLLGELSS
jgi:hypothetical protein